MHKRNTRQNLCVLPSEVILHTLSQSGHVANPMFLVSQIAACCCSKDLRFMQTCTKLQNLCFTAKVSSTFRPQAVMLRILCVFSSQVVACVCSKGFSLMQACRMLQNLCVLLSELILHILSQSGHVAKPMCFIEPNRGSAASPKFARRFLKASLPLRKHTFRTGRRRSPHPPRWHTSKSEVCALGGPFCM